MNGKGIRIGFIGLGGCGARIAGNFHRLDYPAVAIDSSPFELENIDLNEDAKLVLEPGTGTGGRKAKGRDVIEQNAQAIGEFVRDRLADVDRIGVISGLGGGTGANAAEILRLIRETEKPTFAISILPLDTEGTQAKFNAVEAIEDLMKGDQGSIILIDSQRFARDRRDESAAETHNITDNLIALLLDEINSVNHNDSLLPVFSFDPGDFGELLSRRGITALDRINIDSESLTSAGKAVFETWRGVFNSPMLGGMNLTSATACAVIAIASETALSSHAELGYQTIADHLCQVIDGCDLYSALLMARDDISSIYLIFSGMDIPDRVFDLKNQVQREIELISAKTERLDEVARQIAETLVEHEGAIEREEVEEKEAEERELSIATPAEGGLTPEEEESIDIGETPQQARSAFCGLIARIGRMQRLSEIEIRAVSKFMAGIIDMTSASRDPLIDASRDYETLDNFVGQHSFNVGVISAYLGRELGLEGTDLENLVLAALLHDIGMFKISDEIVFAPRKLSDEEMSEIRKHPELGAQMLNDIPELAVCVLSAVIQEHERIDGSGYPNGISGDDLTLISRAIAVCDVYEAISHKRPHRPAYLPYDAMRQIMELSRIQLDYKIVKSFVSVMSIYPIGSYVRLNNGEIALVIDSVANYPFHPVVKTVEIQENKIIETDKIYYLKDDPGVRIQEAVSPIVIE